MKLRLIALTMLLALFASACGEDTQTYPMCQCKFDEICVDEVCSPTTSDIVPAPKDDDKQK